MSQTGSQRMKAACPIFSVPDFLGHMVPVIPLPMLTRSPASLTLYDLPAHTSSSPGPCLKLGFYRPHHTTTFQQPQFCSLLCLSSPTRWCHCCSLTRDHSIPFSWDNFSASLGPIIHPLSPDKPTCWPHSPHAGHALHMLATPSTCWPRPHTLATPSTCWSRPLHAGLALSLPADNPQVFSSPLLLRGLLCPVPTLLSYKFSGGALHSLTLGQASLWSLLTLL